MKLSSVLALLLAMTLIGCRYPNEFRNRSKKADHAVLRGPVAHINGQPTSFWRFRDVFRIPPGSTTCDPWGYKTAEFVATAGGEYVLIRKRDREVPSPVTATAHPSTTNAWIIYDRRDRMTIQDKSSRLVADVPAEDYLFGVASSNSAIAIYLKKNP